MSASDRTTDGITTRESIAALAYFALYLAFSFWSPGSEMRNYLTLVAGPLCLVVILRASDPLNRRPSPVLASFGLRRGNLRTGLLWALVLGLLIGMFQLTQRSAGPELWELIRTGKALYLFPLAAAFGLLTAGFTEEFFFRGFLQTRIERLTGSAWIAVLIVTVAFGLYHVPFAYLNPNWPTAGDFPAALRLGMVEGGLGGVILGAAYVFWKRNLLACIVLHGMIDAVPIMTMIKFGGSGGG
ncbi:MAG: CPBP family intramembrane metalloprotease [Gemmatimonadales bacterium]